MLCMEKRAVYRLVWQMKIRYFSEFLLRYEIEENKDEKREKKVFGTEEKAGVINISDAEAINDMKKAYVAKKEVNVKEALTKEASVTIEASLIMPLVLASVIFVILLSFYSHDRCIMLKAGLEAALRAEEDEAEAGRAMDSALGGIIWVKDIEKDIRADEEEITVEVKGTAALSEGFEGLLISGASVGYSVKAKGETGRGSEYIRAVKKRGGGYCY